MAGMAKQQAEAALQEGGKTPVPEAGRQQADGPNEESRMIAAISYIFGILVAVLIFLLKKDDRYTKFHSAQAIMIDIAVIAAGIAVFFVGLALAAVFGVVTMGIGFFVGFWVIWLVMMVFGLCVLALRLLLAFMAFTGRRMDVPVIGAHARKIAES
jgi:uncharacterized membrane protein